MLLNFHENAVPQSLRNQAPGACSKWHEPRRRLRYTENVNKLDSENVNAHAKTSQEKWHATTRKRQRLLTNDRNYNYSCKHRDTYPHQRWSANGNRKKRGQENMNMWKKKRWRWGWWRPAKNQKLWGECNSTHQIDYPNYRMHISLVSIPPTDLNGARFYVWAETLSLESPILEFQNPESGILESRDSGIPEMANLKAEIRIPRLPSNWPFPEF